jgi:hypothetical protein
MPEAALGFGAESVGYCDCLRSSRYGASRFGELRIMSLSDTELRDSREDLAQWRSPSAFQEIVDSLHERCPSREFKRPDTKFLLDAWILAEFVLHKDVDEVRLAPVSDQWPDGYLRIGGEIKNVEVTIALTEGRRMWAEYQFEGECERDSVENWSERAKEIPAALEKAIKDKVEKHYGSKAWLVVYLNIDEYGIRQVETQQAIRDTKQRYIDSFDGLFVLWKDRLL